jgi:predicted DNA-binding WGR domain protein
MEQRQFEYRGGISKKFWNIGLDGKRHTVQSGRIGTVGKTKTKEFASEDKARASYEKLIDQKLKKGYVERKVLTLLSNLARREGETVDDPLFGRLRWLNVGEGWWDGDVQTADGRSVDLSVSWRAREDVRRLFSRITADLEAVHQRLADEHLPDINKYCWPDSPMTRDAFLSRFQLCGIHINPDGSVYVEFDDPSEEDTLGGHGIGFMFHLDGRIEPTGSG